MGTGVQYLIKAFILDPVISELDNMFIILYFKYHTKQVRMLYSFRYKRSFLILSRCVEETYYISVTVFIVLCTLFLS